MGDRLQDGSRVCIIGGGPAGSFAALHLLRLARERSLHLEVEIFEPRDGRTQGPRSCKGCAGILSHGAVHNLASLGLQMPPEVVQSELRSYVVHVQNQAATVDQPHRERRILSVYRGAGPRLRQGPSLAGFDAWLLDQARAAGARVIRHTSAGSPGMAGRSSMATPRRSPPTSWCWPLASTTAIR